MIALALLGLTGCAEYNISAELNPVEPLPVLDGDALVLEITPDREFEADGSTRVLAGSVPDPSFDTPILVELQRPFTVPGLVMGQLLNPENRAELPASGGPVQGVISLRTSVLPGSARVATDFDGVFEVPLISSDYQITVAPDDPSMPMSTFTQAVDVDLESLDLVLDQGVPIWGQVFENGAPYVDAQVRAVAATGLVGAPVFTDSQGWYEIRVQPGTYTIRTDGIGDGFDPRLTTVVQVGEQGLRFDFTYPEIELHTVQARVLAPDGDPVAFVPFRLRANSLYDYGSGAQVEITGFSDSLGNIVTRAVRGAYTLEVLADVDSEVTSRRVSDFPVETPTDLGDIRLQDLASIGGSVVDPFGGAVANAQVRCTEVGFQGRSWSGFTSDLGFFSLIAADSPLSCAVSPGARDDLALTRVDIEPGQTDVRVELRRGRPIEGEVRFEGDPESLALVEVRDATGRVWGSGLTDDNGRFSIRVEFPQ